MHRYLVGPQQLEIRGWQKARETGRLLAATSGNAVLVHEVLRRQRWPRYVCAIFPDGQIARERNTRTVPDGFGL